MGLYTWAQYTPTTICVDFKNIFQVWQALLAVRELVLPPNEDRDTWIKFAKLCWKNGRTSQARSTLVKLLQVSEQSSLISMCMLTPIYNKTNFWYHLQFDPESSPELTLYHAHPQVALAYLKYQYAVGDELKRRNAFSKLQVSLFLPMYFDGTLQCTVHIILSLFLWGIGVVCAACYHHGQFSWNVSKSCYHVKCWSTTHCSCLFDTW